jgi:hypothetical protein
VCLSHCLIPKLIYLCLAVLFNLCLQGIRWKSRLNTHYLLSLKSSNVVYDLGKGALCLIARGMHCIVCLIFLGPFLHYLIVQVCTLFPHDISFKI